ncbi:MAG TPA: 3-deoxy-D-manno-octulosonic acid transferase [Planctomycetota bacterium]|nr:3-deoxy-D-manno-octulosonic acid transferase [Planctomycetota bacterium]
MDTADNPSTAPGAPNAVGASRLLDVLYLCAAVLLVPYFLYRRLIKRKQSAGLRARMGHVEARSADRRRIWIHAVSVGEAALIEPFVNQMRAADPQLDIVVSTTTVTGQTLARKKYGEQNVFYYPQDLSWAVQRAMDRIAPTVLVLAELEVWPNMTAECVRRGIPVIVINGRISARAARRYRQFWFLVGPSFHRVRRWLVQSDEYSGRLKELGVSENAIEIAGNMKYDAVDTRTDTAARATLRTELGFPADVLVFTGGSTHPTEESELLKAFQQVRAKNPALRLILVPRHPERAADVESEVRAAALNPVRLSALRISAKAQLQADDVLIVDTVGELKNMYKISDVAFVGGSLIPHGGQNVMEPCGLGVAVLHGPHMHNFNDAMEILRACSGSVEVTRDTLAAELEKLLLNSTEARAMASRAREGFLSRQGATRRTVEVVLELLKAAERAKVQGP